MPSNQTRGMNLTLPLRGRFASLKAVVAHHEWDGNDEGTDAGTKGRHTCPNPKRCTIAEHGTKPAVGGSCCERRQTEHKLSTNDTHGHPHTPLLVAGQENPSGDEAGQTGNRRQAVHDLCSDGVVEDFSRQGVHWINEEIQKAKALECTPEDEKNAHDFGSA